MKSRSLSYLSSSKGFILVHVLIFYMFFTFFISMIIIQKQISLKQIHFQEMANLRVDIEREVIRKIRTQTNNDESEFIMFDYRVLISFEDIIKVSICFDTCYKIVVEYDIQNDIILSINYE